ncbi:MAG: hypothetical protein GXP40_00725 [Chloroflexi bacterium]|nr:hypothetical protein [Chloroflexota bacterium]
MAAALDGTTIHPLLGANGGPLPLDRRGGCPAAGIGADAMQLLIVEP